MGSVKSAISFKTFIIVILAHLSGDYAIPLALSIVLRVSSVSTINTRISFSCADNRQGRDQPSGSKDSQTGRKTIKTTDMLCSLPLESMVNMSSQLENSIRFKWYLPVVKFQSIPICPTFPSPCGSHVRSYFGRYFAKSCYIFTIEKPY